MYHFDILIDYFEQQSIHFDYEHKHQFYSNQLNSKEYKESKFHQEKPFQENLITKKKKFK
jgi:hypothetical protein